MLSLTMPILAEAAGTSSAPAGSAPGFSPISILCILGIVAVFYFMILRPQKKKEQQHKDMLSKLERGDQVVTIGGLYGEIESVSPKEDYVILLVDRERGTTLKFRRAAIQAVVTKDSGSAEEKK